MDRTQWIEDLKRVGDDLYVVDCSHALFTRLEESARAAPWIQHEFLMRHLEAWHRDYILMALRRETDRDSRSVSLVRLIGDIAARRIRFTRSDFSDCYEANGLREWGEIPDRRFDELCGMKNCSAYPAHRAFRHMEWINSASNCIRQIVNKEIAHRDQKAKQRSLRKQHVRRVLAAMRRLQAHYQELATGSTPPADPEEMRMIDLPELESPWVISQWHTGLCSIIQNPDA